MTLTRGLKFAIPMSLILWALLFLALLCGAKAARAGQTETIVEESTYQALHLVDTFQTVYIAKHPAEFYETTDHAGWIIGNHPSVGHVFEYMAAEAILHATVTEVLYNASAPRWVQSTWAVVTIAESADNVVHNHSIGIKLAF